MLNYGRGNRSNFIIASARRPRRGLETHDQTRHQRHHNHEHSQENKYRAHAGKHQCQSLVDQLILHIQSLRFNDEPIILIYLYLKSFNL